MGHTPASQSVPTDDGGWVDLELDKLLCMLQELGGHYHLQERAVQVDTSTVLSQACTDFHMNIHAPFTFKFRQICGFVGS